ncbi:C1 family peptidase [Xylanibacter muris]|nr:C1 family peptidase [Xylanibacter muris]
MTPYLHNRYAGIILMMTMTIVFHGCGMEKPGHGDEQEQFTIDVMNKYTPVRNQGRSCNCWAYAMLSAIETEHLMRGDSVCLSVAYVMRSLLRDNYRNYYLTGGKTTFTTRGMGQTLINLIERHGAVPDYSYGYGENINYTVLCNRVRMLSEAAVRHRAGLKLYGKKVDDMIDRALGYPSEHVFMYGAEYTPGEFARSVCAPGEYEAITSFTHHKFYNRFVLETEDNWERNTFYNVPLDTMMSLIDNAVRKGHGVCWEGDISEPGFSFEKGIAKLDEDYGKNNIQEIRQKHFENYETTDDHCMAIVGIGRDRKGTRYYIMKNSWGTDNPYNGLMYVSENYVRMKTVAVYMPKEM